MNRKAIIYARVSSAGDRQSTDRQVADLQNFAAREGIEVLQVFEEKGSGAREDRPVLKECVETVKRGECGILMISEISRLGRSVKVVVNTIDELTKAGVSVYIQDINLWTLNPDGFENPIAKMTMTILALGAEMERKSIVGRLNSGRAQAIENGVKMGRKSGSKLSDKEILAKYSKVASKLRKGLSVREAAAACGVSPATVMKVKKAML